VYLDDIATRLRAKISADLLPSERSDELLLLYAALVRSKGSTTTSSDVHDAWSVWISKLAPEHEALVPYLDLSGDLQAQDAPFRDAISSVARELSVDYSDFTQALFPTGEARTEIDQKELLDLYKTIVGSSEALVQRRQSVNTFFLSINGALLTACGLIVQSAHAERLGALGITVLAVAGLVLCAAWASLIRSFGQLNRGKFKVINALESRLKAAVYAAEWEALGRGEDPKIYRSFTSREIWVPYALIGVHTVTLLVSVAVALGCVSFK
jgi:hypothetical protein